MSGFPTIKVVNDKEMSSRGSINTPVAPKQSATQEQLIVQLPTEVVGIPAYWKSIVTRQSGVAGPSVIVPAQSTQVVGAPTVFVNAPTCTEMKQAFDEVSSVLQNVLSQHEELCTSMQGLASGVEELHCTRARDMETMAQVQATLQRTFLHRVA